MHRSQFKFYGRIDAAGIASVELLRFVDQLLQCDEQLRMILHVHFHFDADERQVCIVDVSKVVVAVQLSRIEIEIEMMILVFEAAQAEHNRLHDTVDAQIQKRLAAVLLQCQHP